MCQHTAWAVHCTLASLQFKEMWIPSISHMTKNNITEMVMPRIIQITFFFPKFSSMASCSSALKNSMGCLKMHANIRSANYTVTTKMQNTICMRKLPAPSFFSKQLFIQDNVLTIKVASHSQNWHTINWFITNNNAFWWSQIVSLSVWVCSSFIKVISLPLVQGRCN